MNIVDHAISAGQSPALILSDGGVMSFGELHVRSQRVAAVLRGAGVRPGDGVALVLPNRPELFEIHNIASVEPLSVWAFCNWSESKASRLRASR